MRRYLLWLGVGVLASPLLAVLAVYAFEEGGQLDVARHSDEGQSLEPQQSAEPVPQESRRAEPATPIGVPTTAEQVRVTDHVDGDTLRVVPVAESQFLEGEAETTVRLLEIDTPESVDPNSSDQCFADEAAAALQGLAPLGQIVWAAPDEQLMDPYGRTLLYLWTQQGHFINLEMVREGFARAVLYEPNDEYIDAMRAAETEARAADRGLWSACAFFGEPRNMVELPAEAQELSLDPRFSSCEEANGAGYGEYVQGRDPEYEWYIDADGDGVVCEF